MLSPLVRDIRLKRVARNVRAGSRVLDLACGNGYLSRFLPPSCKYYGVDRIRAADEGRFHGFLAADLLDPSTPKRLLDLLGEPADYVTCAAFLEHIDDPASLVQAYRGVLRPGGQLIGTTPHPRGRHLHDALARIYLCSRSGAEEHEDFLSKADLERVANRAGGTLVSYETFLMGLNQLFVFSF